MLSVIIPVINAEKDLPGLLAALKTQTLRPDEIIVVDTASVDKTADICRNDLAVKLIGIRRKDFDHGGTRDMALRISRGDIVVFLTQDALPADDKLLENLTKPLSDPDVAVCTGRQIPKSDASKMEQLVREFNYPELSHVRSKEDIAQMGIKTFFCSDVCAAYNRYTYLELGGFDHPLKTNEDMFFAAKAINAGYKIAYAADARVYHSHNFTLKEQFRRNYSQGYEMEKHKALLGEVSKESEGVRLVKHVSVELLKHGRIGSFIHFGFDCIARYTGSVAGKNAYRRSVR